MTPTRDEIAATVRKVLAEVAPDAGDVELEPDVNFRDQIEIDSMDFVAFVLALEKELGTKVPEVDYPRLSSLSGCVAWVEHHAGR